MVAISHRVDLHEAGLHLVTIETTLEDDAPLPSPLTAFMPVWAPGSYLVREFARHVEAVQATADGVPVAVRKVRKNAWRFDHAGARRASVRYRLWANDLSVRSNHADATHALLNGPATFLGFDGFDTVPMTVHIDAPASWRVITALPQRADGAFTADSYGTLVDAPIAAGSYDEEQFTLMGKPHTVAVWPRRASTPSDRARFARDLRAIVETQANLFGASLPYDVYALLLHLWPRTRGGLEHASSATLLASPNVFASRHGYLDLLSLAAHEVFHVWNVKRIRPAAFVPVSYHGESYTRALWWFEGGTSYYDWRTLRLARIATLQEYLEHLAAEIAYVDATPGRLVASLEDASFDAWIKAYRPDENTPNTTVSYYRKGEIVCALLDLEIRARTHDTKSLDDVLFALWKEHGETGVPVADDALEPLFERVAGVPLGDLFRAWVRMPGEIDYDASLAHVGLRIERSMHRDAPASLGLRARSDGVRTLVSAVPRSGAAHRAGIDVGDELLAIEGRRVDGPGSIEVALAGRSPGETLEVLVSREGRTSARAATLDPPRPDQVKLVVRANASPDARARFEAWLGLTPSKPKL